ncbi:MIOREX complex component 1 [Spathaspora sp. JA1]|nr:MIOREX complex component 1 [Spathaspora sp. JA1]
MLRLSLLQHGSIPNRYLSQVRGISGTALLAAKTSFARDRPNKFGNNYNRNSNFSKPQNDRRFRDNNKNFNSKSAAYKYQARNSASKFDANPHRQRDGKHAKPIPTAEELAKSNQSKVQTKLQYFVDTGVIVKSDKPRQFTRRTGSNINSKYGTTQSGAYDINKGFLTLKERYDTVEFIDKEGNPFPISKLTQYDLKYDSKNAKTIFDNLVNIKKITKSSIDKNLILCLLGTNGEQLSDGYFLTKNILELLTLDNEIDRALYLVRMAKDKSSAAVGMNVLMKWVLDKGDVEEGIKMFRERSKSGIPTNNHTLVILFDGIAKASGWGQVNNTLAEQVTEMFKNSREKSGSTIEEFNACLSILVKNFDDQQSKAWDLFTNLLPDYDLNLKEILPNDISFTILINGLKRCMNHNRDLIKQDSDMNRQERSLRLLETEANCIQMADAAFEKMKNLAIENPAKLNMGIQLIVSYLSCYIDKFGSPYRYNEKALYLISQYSPNVRQMFEYVQRAAGVPDVTRVDKSIMKKQDASLQRTIETAPSDIEFKYYETVEEFLPKVIVPDLKPENANPKVSKPIIVAKRGPRVNRAEAPIYRESPLIDFARQSTSKSSKNEINSTINKFLLNLVFDGLMNVGRFNEFVFSLWFSLIKWNGVKLDLDQIADKSTSLNGILSFDELPRYSNNESIEESSDKPIVSNTYDDIVLKNIFLRIAETKGKGYTYTHLIIELFNVLASPKYNPEGIVPSYDHAKLMFYILKEDLKYYKAFNINHNKTRGLFYNQLQEFMTNLYNFNQGYMLLNQRKRSSPQEWVIEELNEMYHTLYSKNWVGVTPEQELYIHKVIIKSNILFFPNFSISLESARRTANILKEKDQLDDEDKQLLKTLKNLSTVRKNDDPETVKKLEKLCRDVYDAITVNPVKIPKEIESSVSAETIEENGAETIEENSTETIEEEGSESNDITEQTNSEITEEHATSENNGSDNSMNKSQDSP